MAVEKEVQTPQDVEAMRRLSAAGWGRRRIARELGCSPETVRKYLRQGGWRWPYPLLLAVLLGQQASFHLVPDWPAWAACMRSLAAAGG